jgi:hypothetical protein
MLIAAMAEPTLPLNVPGVIGAGLASLALDDATSPSWMFASIAALLAWIGWYTAALCIESRSAPVGWELSR